MSEQSFLEDLPKDAEKEDLDKIRENDPYVVLDQLSQDIESRYQGKIHGVITTTSYQEDPDGGSIKEYAFYLVFANKDNYTYRLFEAACVNEDGKYPIKITSFSNPADVYNDIDKKADFEDIIRRILKDERARFIILSNYKM